MIDDFDEVPDKVFQADALHEGVAKRSGFAGKTNWAPHPFLLPPKNNRRRRTVN